MDKLEKLILETVKSDLSVEILTSTIRELAMIAGKTPDETYEILLSNYNDWEK